MFTYKFSDVKSDTCPGDYDYAQIRKKYESGSCCNFGMERLLAYGFIDYLGWRYVFHDKGELRRYLYLLDNGDTGTGWAPSIKLLERNLHHKVVRAFRIDSRK